MYTFWQGNVTSDDESDTVSESHFAYFEQDGLEASLAAACAASAAEYVEYCDTQRTTSTPAGTEARRQTVVQPSTLACQ